MLTLLTTHFGFNALQMQGVKILMLQDKCPLNRDKVHKFFLLIVHLRMSSGFTIFFFIIVINTIFILYNMKLQKKSHELKQHAKKIIRKFFFAPWKTCRNGQLDKSI